MGEDDILKRLWAHKLPQLDRKARFARVRAARGWSPLYQGSYIDPPHQFHPLDPTLKASGASGAATIRL